MTDKREAEIGELGMRIARVLGCEPDNADELVEAVRCLALDRADARAEAETIAADARREVQGPEVAR